MPFDTITSSNTPDHLVIGSYPEVLTGETVLTGNNLLRGTVVGMITASSKLVAFDTALVNGAQIPYGVLMSDTDATASDLVGPVASSGKFNEASLTLGGATTLTAAVKILLRTANIYTESVIDANARVSD